jgi:tRNA U34 5-carboxymethylaminomethyl modifying enzyme MnmG/GidA
MAKYPRYIQKQSEKYKDVQALHARLKQVAARVGETYITTRIQINNNGSFLYYGYINGMGSVECTSFEEVVEHFSAIIKESLTPYTI